MTQGAIHSRSITPPAASDSQPEPMQIETTSQPNQTSPNNLPGDHPAISTGTQPSSSSSAPSPELKTALNIRSNMTPSPVLGTLQQGGGAVGVAKSPAASSTHSSLCSIEESSPGLSPSLYFLREAHHFLGRYLKVTV